MAKKSTNFYQLEIVNWDKWHTHGTKKRLEWFKLSAFLYDDPEFIRLSSGERDVWLWVLCEAAKGGAGVIKFSPQMMLGKVRVKSQNIPKVISELFRIQWIRVLNAPPLAGARAELELEERDKKKKRREEPPQTAVAVAPPDPKQGELILATEKGSPTSRCIAHYCTLFKEHYKTSAVVMDKDAGQMARAVKSQGEAGVKRLLEAYFKWPDSWHFKKGHTICLFVGSIQEVKIFADSGKFTTMTEVRDKDREVTGRKEQHNAWEEMDPERQRKFLDNFEDTKTKALEGK